ncbi:NUDIX domain-containing protein [Paramicrobacterium chengjingii]|uniref:NUDIX domain-containing protein n=1 Tax=Paramicrobacterium chengjingii TaxID=2769067 RepID=UPI001422B300|nr:NUDIX domain-containing protein [Microbacterium chengjingii]
MPISPYVRGLRSQVGHSLLLLPGVTAVIRREDRFLLAKQRDTQLWSLIGGGIEPAERPEAALAREVEEELGVSPNVGRIIGAYGGPELMNTYPNGDHVSYVTIAYDCSLVYDSFDLEQQELIDVAWLDIDSIAGLARHAWIDRVLADASH